jgi:hypothetical protein
VNKIKNKKIKKLNKKRYEGTAILHAFISLYVCLKALVNFKIYLSSSAPLWVFPEAHQLAVILPERF